MPGSRGVLARPAARRPIRVVWALALLLAACSRPPPATPVRTSAAPPLADDQNLPPIGGLPAGQMASANRRAEPGNFAPLYQNEMQLNDPEFRAYALAVNARGDGIDIGLGMEIDGQTGKPIRPIPRMFRMV